MPSIGDSPNITCHNLGVRDALHAIAPSMCRRRHVYTYVHGRCVADATWYMITAYAHAVRVTDIYASSESTPLLHDSLPGFPLGNKLYASSESTPLLQDSLPRFPLGNQCDELKKKTKTTATSNSKSK